MVHFPLVDAKMLQRPQENQLEAMDSFQQKPRNYHTLPHRNFWSRCRDSIFLGF